LQLRDKLQALALPLLTERYAGTTLEADGTAEGDADLAGQIKPRIFGTVTNVGLKLVNQYELLYQASVSELASMVVYDGGLALTYAGDYPALSSLVAASLSPGYYATCLVQGIARLGGSPTFQVTADAADASSASDLTAAAIVQRMLNAFGVPSGDINAASFAAVQSGSPAAVGIVVNEENCADAIATVLSSAGAVLVPSVLGEYRVVQLAAPIAGSYRLRCAS
jgi:hypothetical protein